MEAYIRQQQKILDEIIFEAATKYHEKNKIKANYPFDIVESCKEQWLLSDKEKKDLCYDRPSIGFTYSLWYHARRVNTFLKYFLDQLSGHSYNKVEIYDLGAGAGAVQWAVGLVYAAHKVKAIKIPEINIVNIDTSPFMLEYNRDYLWQFFLKKYPVCSEIKTEYKINSWNSPNKNPGTNSWIVASYLFDNSEKYEQTAEDFKKILDKFQPNKVLLTTSYNKRDYLQNISQKLNNSYSPSSTKINNQIFSGKLEKVNEFRKTLNIELNTFHKIESPPFSNIATWDIDSLSGIILNKNISQLGLPLTDISLYQPPFKRTDVSLNEKQEEAAKHESRPTKIIGPAGCGKSVVITERIKDLIEKAKYSSSIRILLTTFNKDLLKQLGEWLKLILDESKIVRTTIDGYASFFKLRNETEPFLFLFHFDILPTRLGNIAGDIRDGIDPVTREENHSLYMRKSIEKFKNDPRNNTSTSFLLPQFLLEEYHRMIYGYDIQSLTEYQNLARKGRGRLPSLNYNSNKRSLIYDIIMDYLNFLELNRYASFTTRRSSFLKQLKMGTFPEEKKFTHVFVDELQDCTYSDYQIFYKLLRKNHEKHFVIAGDLAQSIQLGTSLYIPKPSDVLIGNWKNHFLEGSYRLPFRISEAIQQLSKNINIRFGKREDVEVSVITPYRGAPPGARVIFVYADSLIQMVDKVKAIYQDFKIFHEDENIPISIYEKDYELVNAFRGTYLNIENEFILKSKGLEKKFVFWSTRTKMLHSNEIYEFVYTILTRTSSILVIGLSKHTEEVYHEIINTFRKDRILFWDSDTKTHFGKFCKHVDIEPIVEDEQTI